MYGTNELKKNIIKSAEKMGITEIGFCEHDGKTCIACLFPYYFEDGEKSNISMYARGKDYHIEAKKILEKILSPYTDDFEIFVDIGPADNIYVAQKSGLGVLGKNGLLINERLGSYFFIGYAKTSLLIKPDAPLFRSCLSCNKCILSCPGGALSEKGFILEKCASHISQKKGELNEEEIEILKKSSLIFGCDICQAVCPMNKGKGACLPEFSKDRICYLKKDELINLSNREFMEKFGERAFSWRGKNVLLRNLNILKD